MFAFSLTEFRDLRRAVTAMYTAVDRESAQIRGAHLGAVLRLTPYAMAANVGSSALVVWAFRAQVPWGMWLWWMVLLGVCGLAWLSWWGRRDRPLDTASPRAVRRATWNAAALAGVWAVMPLCWFPGASPAQQIVIATLVTGMLSAGTLSLSPLPWASLTYAALYAVASLGALWRDGNPTYAAVAALLGFYAPTVVIVSLFSWRKATALLRSQAEAVRQERTLAVLLQDFEQNAGEALWETGADGHLNHVSPRLAQLLGVRAGEARDLPLLGWLSQCGVQGVAALQLAMDAGRPFRDIPLSWADGAAERHLAINGKRLLDDRGRTLGWRGVLADVTDKVQSEQQLRRMAHTDSLTGLANRFTLRDALASLLREGRHGTLLMIDLDHFKAVNDSLGHTAGDELLKAASMRLRACVRPDDLIARLGGDEFAVLMTHSNRVDDAEAMAQRLIASLAQPIDVQGRPLRVGASVGVAVSDDSGLGVDDLVVQSDTALYAAKEAGRGRYAIYSPALGERSRRRVAIEAGLRHAIELGQLALHWQPKVDIASWQFVGAEGLMRWEHPTLGRVNPSEFIAIAEQGGLIDELGLWALRQACQAAAGPLQGLGVSVNVSPVQLRGGNFVSHVRDALRESQIEPSRLELEITESVFMDDVNGAVERLHALRSLGVRIALDDFGTGYSSLAYLRRFPFDTLKIDRAFVNEVLLRKDARAIVQMISQLAATLGMRTVSEGVETAQQLTAVALAGCHEVQGYLVSPPRPLAEFVRLRRGWRAELPATTLLH